MIHWALEWLTGQLLSFTFRTLSVDVYCIPLLVMILWKQGSLGSYIPKYFVLIRYFVSEKASFLKCIPYIHVAIFIFILNVQSQMSVMQMSPSFNYRIVKPLRLFNQLHSVPCMDVCPPHNFF